MDTWYIINLTNIVYVAVVSSLSSSLLTSVSENCWLSVIVLNISLAESGWFSWLTSARQTPRCHNKAVMCAQQPTSREPVTQVQNQPVIGCSMFWLLCWTMAMYVLLFEWRELKRARMRSSYFEQSSTTNSSSSWLRMDGVKCSFI